MIYFVWFVVSCAFCLVVWLSYAVISAMIYSRRHQDDDEE